MKIPRELKCEMDALAGLGWRWEWETMMGEAWTLWHSQMGVVALFWMPTDTVPVLSVLRGPAPMPYAPQAVGVAGIRRMLGRMAVLTGEFMVTG